MQKSRILCGLIVAGLCINCSSPNAPADGPGKIVLPAQSSKLVAGDTITVSWTNAIRNAGVYYNYNDTAGAHFHDALWHKFPDSLIVSSSETSFRITTMGGPEDISNDFRIRVADAAASKFSETGQLSIDNIVLLKPAGNETYKVGDTVLIRFRRNPNLWRVSLTFTVGPRATHGIQLTPMASLMFLPPNAPTSTYDTTWVVGSEQYYVGQSPEYPSDSCYIYAYSYYLGMSFAGDLQSLGLNSDLNQVPFRISQN